MKKIVIITAMLVYLWCGSAYAEILVKDYEKQKEDPAFKIYILGVGIGFMWANIWFKDDYGAQLYCQPDKLALGAANYMRILDDSIKYDRERGTLKPDRPVEVLLLLGLQRTFPCPK